MCLMGRIDIQDKTYIHRLLMCFNTYQYTWIYRIVFFLQSQIHPNRYIICSCVTTVKTLNSFPNSISWSRMLEEQLRRSKWNISTVTESETLWNKPQRNNWYKPGPCQSWKSFSRFCIFFRFSRLCGVSLSNLIPYTSFRIHVGLMHGCGKEAHNWWAT